MYCDSLIHDVIYARDNWLTENGIIFPDRAKLYLCAIEARKYKNDHIEWWKNVYDFSKFLMSLSLFFRHVGH